MKPAFFLMLQQGQMWMVYVLGAVTFLYILLRPMLKKRKDSLGPAPKMGLSQQRAVEREMSNLLVELSEMARKVTGQLDTRSKKLEVLMDEADRRIEQLQRLVNSAGRGAEGAGTVETAREAGVEGGGDGKGATAVDSRYGEIYALADEGKNVREIAQQLNRPQGEIELILALRSR